MKTLTLRLSEVEAEALERIAYANRLSKNKMIEKLLANTAARYDEGVEIFDDEIISISALFSFAKSNYDYFKSREWESNLQDEREIEKIVRILNYVLENNEEGDELTSDQLTQIADWRMEVLDCYKNL